MYPKFYYKITIRFYTGKPITYIEHSFTDNKRRIEDRLILDFKLKYQGRVHSFDIWQVSETDPMVIEYKRVMEI